MGLPRDANLIADPQARFGNGNWDRPGYWALNHGTPMPAAMANSSLYQMYRYEIETAGIPDNSSELPPGEDGNAQCHNDSAATNDFPDRRMMIIAVIDCLCHAEVDDLRNRLFVFELH